jgi:hypothetical protein
MAAVDDATKDKIVLALVAIGIVIVILSTMSEGTFR